MDSDLGNGWRLTPVSDDSNDRKARYYAVLAPEDPSEMRPDEDEDPISADTSESCGCALPVEIFGVQTHWGLSAVVVEKVRLLETKSRSRGRPLHCVRWTKHEAWDRAKSVVISRSCCQRHSHSPLPRTLP